MNIKEFNETVNVCNKSLQDVLFNIGHEAPALQSAATIEYAEAIAKESVRNNMGLVRVLFLGASNSGKSALINNLARKIIVPEVIHTSTLMPTWIGRTEDYANEGVTVNYFDIDKEGRRKGSLKSKRETIDDFRCYYCYTEKDLADRDRLVKPDRFKSMELNEAYISLHEVEGACKDYALVLVDTLGNGASSVDDEKAQHNMKNCDFAFVLVDSLGNLTDQDIDFFGSTLFNPKVSNIKPEHIIFVINKIDLSPSRHGSIENCKNNIAALLKKAYSGKVPEKLYERLCSQIVTYSALYNRLAFCGVYPYKEDAIKINGLNRKELETSGEKKVETIRTIVKEKEEFEEEKSYLPKEMLLKKGYYEDFNAILGKVIGNMFADGTIYDNHLNGTKEMAMNIRLAIQNRINALASNAEAIEAKIAAFQKAKETIQTLSGNYEQESETIARNFPSEVDTYIKHHSQQLLISATVGINKMIDGIKIDVPHGNYTPKSLKELTSIEIENDFLPSLLKPVPKIVDLICNTISANIFTPVQTTRQTPYRQIVDKLSQSMNNYITSVLDEIRAINSDNKFKVTVVNKSIFEKKISDSLYEMSVLLIIIIQKQIDEIINTSISSTVRKSLHGWWTSVKIFFGGGNVDKMFEKMEEAARTELRNKINSDIAGRLIRSEGFLGKDATLNLYSLLSKATRECDNMVKLYLSNIEHELNALRDHLQENQGRIEFYRDFATEKVNKPLDHVIEEIDRLRADVIANGIDTIN
ncbi:MULTISPECIES: dynamin family protein [Butyricimonas]|uniref:dynamin family protein n=1 Tax=Butyricimonas TaxID=574697 RepID=UPI0007FB3723|nr:MULTISPECIES: dynamin family protein [Butyricimonas]